MIDLSPIKNDLNGKPIAVFGLARTGLSVLRACQLAGIKTLSWDDDAARRRDVDVTDLYDVDFKDIGLLVLSPGVPLTHPKPHPLVEKARAAGVDIVCDIELFLRTKPPAKIIGVTGTNGKSTTVALIGHIFLEAGKKAVIGGNIGAPILDQEELEEGGFYILEMSSYQLDLTPSLDVDTAVLINLAPDHLDRHGGMEGYIAAKTKIFRGEGCAVIGVDDLWSRSIAEKIDNRAVVRVCVERSVLDVSGAPSLPGRHNLQNALVAQAVCKLYNISDTDIQKGLNSFPGLNHRQYLVSEKNRVRYINDSKATNAQSAAMALSCYDTIYWIAGGQAKEGGFDELVPCLSHIAHAFLIGEAAPVLKDFCETHGVSYTICETLGRATQAAHDMAQQDSREATVLLSPACASWDQFDSFEHRGDVFADVVTKLLKEAA